MSRGPGRIERAIEAAFKANPDMALNRRAKPDCAGGTIGVKVTVAASALGARASAK